MVLEQPIESVLFASVVFLCWLAVLGCSRGVALPRCKQTDEMC